MGQLSRYNPELTPFGVSQFDPEIEIVTKTNTTTKTIFDKEIEAWEIALFVVGGVGLIASIFLARVIIKRRSKMFAFNRMNNSAQTDDEFTDITLSVSSKPWSSEPNNSKLS